MINDKDRATLAKALGDDEASKEIEPVKDTMLTPPGYYNRKARRRFEAVKKRADFKQFKANFRKVQKEFGTEAAMKLVGGRPK